MSLQDDMLSDTYQAKMKKLPTNLAVGIVLGFVVAIAIAAAIFLTACGGATMPAQDARVGAYSVELDQCTEDAKTLDASASGKIAADNACQCTIAAKYGWQDSGVLGCPQAGSSDGGVQ
jgi:hypothetical protein